MARKPTRFWHPARRLFLHAQSKARSFVGRRDDSTKLEDVRSRLQHYLRAMYGESVPIESIALPKQAGWAVRTLMPSSFARSHISSESDAKCIRLPASLSTGGGNISPLDQYRVMAVQHAERMRRASANHSRTASSDLERDLYQLAEAAAIDAQIIASQPGLRTALEAARAQAMADRPKPRFRTRIERHVEEMIRRAWSPSSDDGAQIDTPALSINNDAAANAEWARRASVALEIKFGQDSAKVYRRVQEVTLWQTTVNAQLPVEQHAADETETPEAQNGRPPDSWDAPAPSLLPGANPSQSSENSSGRPSQKSRSSKPTADTKAHGADAGGDGGKDGNSNATESNTEQTVGQTREEVAKVESRSEQTATAPGGRGDQTVTSHSTNEPDEAADDAALAEGPTFRYPEWDFHAQAFNASGTIVRVVPPSTEPSDWALRALQEHARETRRAKRQFERLRSDRLRLRRQVQGEDLDLEACVEAMVDRRIGIAPTDRLYSHVRPGRRELAITLLIDVSGSTGKEVSDDQRVIDIERIAALVATAAFDALGDDYAILAFSSAGAANVRVHTLKEFGEKNSPVVLQRISALEPHGNTRLGAAVRHAAATLNKHSAPHRLLLILTDGKPSDYDWYFTDYAIQDSRQAVMQARLDGIHPFCITVDTADDETYLADIFGSAGYRVVSRPSQLSQALLVAVQRMIGAN